MQQINPSSSAAKAAIMREALIAALEALRHPKPDSKRTFRNVQTYCSENRVLSKVLYQPIRFLSVLTAVFDGLAHLPIQEEIQVPAHHQVRS